MIRVAMAVFFMILCEWISLSAQGRPETQTKPEGNSSFGTVFEGPPGRAALYSLLLPGAGQIYNGRWWKAPIVWGIEGTVAYFLIDRINVYKDLNTCYISLIEQNPAAECGSITDISTAFNRRQTARSNRELAWVFMGLTHVLNVVEAFVDRHLMNFDTSEDLSYHNRPLQPFSASLEVPVLNVVSVRISLNKRIHAQ